MWSHRDELMDEIQNLMLTKPLETSVAEYQELIDGGQAWNALLRLFKMKCFPQGLGIVIRTTEERSDTRIPASSVSPRLPGSGTHSAASPQTSSQLSFVAGVASTQSDLAQVPNSTACAGDEVRVSEVEKAAVNNAFDGRRSLTLEEDVASSNDRRDKGKSPAEKMPPSQVNAVTARRKRKRTRAGEESAEDDGGYRPSPSELRALMEGVPAGEPAEYGHRGLNASMKRLENKARNLEREQARAMSELIEALLEVPPSQVFMNVAKRLKYEIPVGALVKYRR